MSPDNLHKYVYFLVLMLLIVGYGLLSGLYLKFKFTKLFYIRMSILSYLFYVLSDNLLYTLVFTIFILISVNIYHKNSMVEHYEGMEGSGLEDKKDKKSKKADGLDEAGDYKEDMIEQYNNKQIIKEFYEYSNKLLENENFINSYGDSTNTNTNNNKIKNITNNINKIKGILNKTKKKDE